MLHFLLSGPAYILLLDHESGAQVDLRITHYVDGNFRIIVAYKSKQVQASIIDDSRYAMSDP